MRQAEITALNECNFDLFRIDPEEEFVNQITAGSFVPTEEDLTKLFHDLNLKYFDGKLPDVQIEWSTRMKHAGKFITRDRIIRLGRAYHEHYPGDIVDTLKHEMLHLIYPYHNREFKREAHRIGTSLYAKNYPGMLRGMKYMYICPGCGTEYPSRKMLRNRSCGRCSQNGFDPRFKLKFVRRLTDR
jgi:predicted SprT family Zn-dependent metalloprotease